MDFKMLGLVGFERQTSVESALVVDESRLEGAVRESRFPSLVARWVSSWSGQ